MFGIQYTATTPVAMAEYSTVKLEVNNSAIQAINTKVRGLGGHGRADRSGARLISSQILQACNIIGVWEGDPKGVLKNYDEVISMLLDRFYTKETIQWQNITREQMKDLFNKEDLTADYLKTYISESYTNVQSTNNYNFKSHGGMTIPIEGIPVPFEGTMSFDRIKQTYSEAGIHVEEQASDGHSIIVPKTLDIFTIRQLDSLITLTGLLQNIRVTVPHGNVNMTGTILLTNQFNPAIFEDFKKKIAKVSWAIHVQIPLHAAGDAILRFDSSGNVLGALEVTSFGCDDSGCPYKHTLKFEPRLELEVSETSIVGYLIISEPNYPVSLGIKRLNVLDDDSIGNITSHGKYPNGVKFDLNASMTKKVKP